MRFSESAELDGEAVLLDVPDAQTPDVVRALVDAGVDVHEAVVTERTLEDVFFEMTRAGTHTERGLFEESGTEVRR
jgi:ABC-2 type transport system ATP-binding protein